jgi:hypothetical protein
LVLALCGRCLVRLVYLCLLVVSAEENIFVL